MNGRTALTDPATAAGRDHVRRTVAAIGALEREGGLDVLCRWGTELHRRLSAGARLLLAGNGGSAAQAQHLAAELVGRYHGERRPFSAMALTADSSTVTALGNDYGIADLFARQVQAHGRPGDVLVCLSTSGRSANVVRAVEAARATGVRSWALTGAGPNPLASAADESLAVGSDHTATIQEVHQLAVHLVCESFDRCEGVVP